MGMIFVILSFADWFWGIVFDVICLLMQYLSYCERFILLSHGLYEEQNVVPIRRFKGYLRLF